MTADFSKQRSRLVTALQKRGILDDRVLAAMRAVPRECFVPPRRRSKAYSDSALPVAGGQTISQPFVVALMTQLLQLRGGESVLEIGTGTGYQTAILAKLARRVVTIERLPQLMQGAQHVISELGLTNVEFHIGDGTAGRPRDAPYDAILVTAGGPEVPEPLYEQLRIGGRLVIPVGDEESQSLLRVVKTENGPEQTDAGECRFVKLIGEVGWPQ